MKKIFDRKKGQLPTLETIAVLFIFFIIIFFGLIFYSKFQEISFQHHQEELLAKRAMDTTLEVLFLPELQCSRAEAEALDNCVDIEKLESLISLMPRYENDYYFNIFSFAKISFQEIYPNPDRAEWVLYEKEKPDWVFSEPTFFVVTFRDETDPDYAEEKKTKFSFGYLKVEVYS